MRLPKRSLLVGTSLGLTAAVLVYVGTALAQGNDLGVTKLAEQAGAAAPDIKIVVARIIRAIFGVLGLVALVLVLYAGFLWMTSGGDEEKIANARRLLTNAVIGLAIMFSAFGIAQFVISRLLVATGIEGGGAGGRGARGIGGIPFSGSLGNGIIENHYPGRGATDVPRNARVVVTFKEPIRIASFVRGYDDRGTPLDVSDDVRPPELLLEDSNFKLFRDADGIGRALESAGARVGFTEDLKTFVFDPADLLGSPSENVGYTVSLTGGTSGIKKADGDPAFGGTFSEGYRWNFVVGTATDTTPPQVTSVIPTSDSRNPRNTIIEVNFSEAMDPTTVTGALPAFRNLLVWSGSPPAADVPGAFTIGNGYRTIRYTSSDRCATNACGGEVYCLPGGTRIAVTVKAASLGATPPEADPSFVPANGATDMTGNSLDGDRDLQAEGPNVDSYRYEFNISNVIDLTPPVVESLSPGLDEELVAQDRRIEVTFNKLMSLVSMNSQSVNLQASPEPAEPTCYTVGGEHLSAEGIPDGSGPHVRSRAVTNHCLFQPETSYVPVVREGVQDTLQNCYFPGAATVPGTSCSLRDLEAANASFCCSGEPCGAACVVSGGRPVCPP